MKLEVTLTPADQALSDQDLLAKALGGAAQAVRRHRPHIQAHVHAKSDGGGDLRALGDLGDRIEKAYALRMERMLSDIADVLHTPPKVRS